MDWGETQWDVDLAADSLNKSLFGKRKGGASQVKADLVVSVKSGSTRSLDSDEDENLSKKSKKKLKERKRKENKRSKVQNVLVNGNQKLDTKTAVEEDVSDNVTKKSKKVKTVAASDKLQEKTKAISTSTTKETVVSLGKSESVSDKKKLQGAKKKKKEKTDQVKPLEKLSAVTDKGREKVKEKKKKRKISHSEEQDEDAIASSKQKKAQEGNPDESGGDQPKKKRKRKKKKKPNSKKNKYKHLGLKSKQDVKILSESGSEDEDENVGGDEKDSSGKINVKHMAKSYETESMNNKKRKNSIAEEVLSKKRKVEDESADVSPLKKKVKKEKKNKQEENDGDMNIQNTKAKKKVKKIAMIDENYADKETNNEKVDKKETNKKADEAANKVEKNVQQESRSKSAETENSQPAAVSKKSKRQKKTNQAKNAVEAGAETTLDANSVGAKPSPFLSSLQGSEFQQKMVDKLASARFRFINEQLYTIRGGEAFRMFQQDKSLVDAYHAGFQGQVRQWPVNPLDIIIKQLSAKPAKWIVADFGCGEARLSASVPQKVYSFDLYAVNKRVTVCDMAKTPLEGSSVDVAVFCLSLMGTNLSDYLVEANRVLKDGGILKIAEVASRFTVPTHFINAVSSMGFKAVNTRELSTMFFLMDFKKVKSVDKTSKAIKAISLKPCVYKKR